MPSLTGKPIVNSPFIIQEYLCGGAFGQVYTGINKNTLEKVAVKLESMDADKAQLYLEFGFYKKLSPCPYTPIIHFFGICDNFNALVMEMLGPSLMAMFKKMGQSLSLKTTAALGVKLMEIMEFLHSHSLLYRDVKPENFLLGVPNSSDALKVHVVGMLLSSFHIFKCKPNLHFLILQHVNICANIMGTIAQDYNSL